VDTEANLSADLSDIENKQDTTNALLTTQAADLAAVKTQLATGTIAVTGGGGGGGGGASAAYNATLPTYTSGASSTLQTDVNGRLITTGPDLATIATEALAIDNKLPSLSSGRVPVEANNASSQVYSFTQTGVVATNSVLIGPIDCLQFREVSVQMVSAGAGFSLQGQISNDGTNWILCPAFINTGNIGLAQFSTPQIYNYTLSNARFFRVIQNTAQTSGTTTLVAYASQQATPKLYQSVTGSVTVSSGVITQISPNFGSGGFTLYHTLVSAASTNSTSVKGTSGSIGTLILTNTAATWAYFKLVNKASAPTTGTDTAVINIGVAPNTTLDCSTAYAGIRMTTGIAYYVSGGSSLTDNTALPAAGTFLVNMTYV
jgi:hypothetical protein